LAKSNTWIENLESTSREGFTVAGSGSLCYRPTCPPLLLRYTRRCPLQRAAKHGSLPKQTLYSSGYLSPKTTDGVRNRGEKRPRENFHPRESTCRVLVLVMRKLARMIFSSLLSAIIISGDNRLSVHDTRARARVGRRSAAGPPQAIDLSQWHERIFERRGRGLGPPSTKPRT